LEELIQKKNDIINQLDHSTNNIRAEMLSLKKSFTSVNDELMLKDKAVSYKFAFLYKVTVIKSP